MIIYVYQCNMIYILYLCIFHIQEYVYIYTHIHIIRMILTINHVSQISITKQDRGKCCVSKSKLSKDVTGSWGPVPRKYDWHGEESCPGMDCFDESSGSDPSPRNFTDPNIPQLPLSVFHIIPSESSSSEFFLAPQIRPFFNDKQWQWSL